MSEKKDSTSPETPREVDHLRTTISYNICLYDTQGHFIHNPDSQARAEANARAAHDILRHLQGLMILISLVSESKAMRDKSSLFLALENVGELGSLITDEAFSAVDDLKDAHDKAVMNRDELGNKLREHIRRELGSILREDNADEPIN